MNPTPNDRQVGGQHYASTYQHWDFVNDTDLGYFEAQITRYVSRSRKKNGLQDLEKAKHYVEKLRSLYSMSKVIPRRGSFVSPVQRFAFENQLSQAETWAIDRITHWEKDIHLVQLIDHLDRMIAEHPTKAYVDQGREAS